MADRIKGRVGIAAPSKAVWETLVDKEAWEKWHGVPVTEADWTEGGSISFGGPYACTSKIKDYVEGKCFTVDGPWVDEKYSLEEVPEGTYIEILKIGKGATWMDNKVGEEEAKIEAELVKFAELVPDPDEEPAPAEEPEPVAEEKPAEEPAPAEEEQAEVPAVAEQAVEQVPEPEEAESEEHPGEIPVDLSAFAEAEAAVAAANEAKKKRNKIIAIGAAALAVIIIIIIALTVSSDPTKDTYKWGDMEFKITNVTDDLTSIDVEMKEAPKGKWVAAVAEIQNGQGIRLNQLTNILFKQGGITLDGSEPTNVSFKSLRFEINGGIADGTVSEQFTIIFDMPTTYTPSGRDIIINENVEIVQSTTVSSPSFNLPTSPTVPTVNTAPTITTPTVQTPTITPTIPSTSY